MGNVPMIRKGGVAQNRPPKGMPAIPPTVTIGKAPRVETVLQERDRLQDLCGMYLHKIQALEAEVAYLRRSIQEETR